ncbi:hypothetical protein VB774_10010 [Pseudanabaena galeata UHCC 0370]|uniref:Transposase n=1 Tax=Pseudanabaena galeata UHCC 0370 TaxID=3110310 RepID=A0ABU5TI12_9CYAN|nr:hypothetical protein [Pseudanabaena galeata]MEA5477953.1 hypothetical protein [Pseudanabaena galeata UHCC 0370]
MLHLIARASDRLNKKAFRQTGCFFVCLLTRTGDRLKRTLVVKEVMNSYKAYPARIYGD